MRKFLTALAATAVLSTGSLGLGTATASARSWGHHYGGGHYYHGGGHYYRGGGHWHGGGAALGAGIAGLALGTIVGGALASPGYYEEPGYYYRPVPVQRVYPVRRYAPSYYADHVQVCRSHYRSYDARSDTFLGYDGYRHYCQY